MEYGKFIKPREVEIDGTTYAISQIPALESQDIYRIVAKSVADNGVIGITMIDSHTARTILSYVAVRMDDQWFSLDTEMRINNYLVNKNTMERLIVLMVRENWGFLIDGNLLDVLGMEEAAESE
jgi:hypothetical protein